ncbi:MAG TPA: hypothetical protein VK116_10215, partial [Planctomycetota bacterium]|nr:hypothetical protein [Planctomycetota bacterium]
MFPRILVETIDGKGQRGWAGAVARVEARLGSIRDPLPAIALISALWAAGAYAISGSVLAGCAVFAAALVGAWIMGVSCRSRVARRDAELARA